MIEVNDLHKSFGDLHILKGISTTIQRGEKVVIIGPSGSGKKHLSALSEPLGNPYIGAHSI